MGEGIREKGNRNSSQENKRLKGKGGYTTKMYGFYREEQLEEGQPALRLKKFRVRGMACHAGGPVTDRD